MANWQFLLLGLGIGLLVAAVLWVVMTFKRISAQKKSDSEIAKYKEMLAQRMELESEGMAKLKKENEELRSANENFRVSLQTMSQKPGKREIARLQVYQTAVDRLTINSPGFGPAWQAALKESEDEFSKTLSGTIPFLRKFIPNKTDAQLIEED